MENMGANLILVKVVLISRRKGSSRCEICSKGMYESRIARIRREILSQYTGIDEYTRLRYTWFTNVHDTYTSGEFAKRLVRYFPFKIKTIQTDNWFEFTNKLSWNAFLKENNI